MREIKEELGIDKDPKGKSFHHIITKFLIERPIYSCPGSTAANLYFCAAAITPEQVKLVKDGNIVGNDTEEEAVVVARFSREKVMDMLRKGEI